MNFTVLDWILAAVVAFFTVMGLFKGFSGQLGSLAGMAAALVAGYFLFMPIKGFVIECDWVSGIVANNAIASILDFILMLVVFGCVRRIVAKFVSLLVPQPMNAILGGLIGVLKSLMIVGILAATGILQSERLSDGFLASHSQIVKAVGQLVDSNRL
ncbi:MAG: CvpA family protein [Kiritimatiellae bacterium]|nr:CvpA family protein [Kiritimatiellia bacterium]